MISGYVDLAEDLDWADPEADPGRARKDLDALRETLPTESEPVAV